MASVVIHNLPMKKKRKGDFDIGKLGRQLNCVGQYLVSTSLNQASMRNIVAYFTRADSSSEGFRLSLGNDLCVSERVTMKAKHVLCCLLILLFHFQTESTAQENEELAAEFKASVSRAEAMATQATIYRDTFGVPHVFGPSDASVVFGFTYARAEDEFQKIQTSLLTASGRLSEMLGPTAYLSDRSFRLFEIPQHARQEYENCDAAFKEILIAYADALNFYVHKHRQEESVVIKCFQPWHALAAGRSMNLAMFSLSPEYKQLLEAARRATPDEKELQQPKPEQERDGSNMWAIGPRRTTTGNAMLFINPHIPLDQLYEGHMCSEEGLNVSGGFAYGSFLFPFAGHNEKIGWSLTVNYPDVIDVYIEDFSHKTDPTLHRYDGSWKSATTWEDSINVKQVTGELKPVKLDCLKTQHGPVFFKVGDKGYSVAAPKMAEGGFPQQLYAMSKAKNLAEFKTAVGQCALVFHNVMYADVEGNIWYVYNCATPKRNQNIKWNQPVSGATSKTDWNGYHSIDELPQVLNPDCGWMQNCNSSPFSTSLAGQNPLREKFPSYIGRDDRDNNRVKISTSILGRPEKISFEDLVELAWDTRVLEADVWVPYLVKAFEANDEKANLKPVIEALSKWNRKVSVDSSAATVFHLWYEKSAPMIRQDSLTQASAIEHLENVANELTNDFGNWSVDYGEMFRHQRPDSQGKFAGDSGESFPIAGGHPQVGMVFTFLSRKVPDSKRRYGFHGHSYVSVLDLDPQGIKSMSMVPFGQSGDTASIHYLDQAPLYADGKFKTALFGRQEIVNQSKLKYHPGE